MNITDYCLIACKVFCAIFALAALLGTLHATHIAAYKRGVEDGVKMRKADEKCHCTECWLRDHEAKEKP